MTANHAKISGVAALSPYTQAVSVTALKPKNSGSAIRVRKNYWAFPRCAE